MQYFSFIFMLLLFFSNTYADNYTQRGVDWFYSDANTSISADPTDLKYFKYYDVLPDSIEGWLMKNKDLSTMSGKRLYVGVGIVDAEGKDCRVFKPSETGQDKDYNALICQDRK